jgi:hypothetical protein
VTAGAPSRPQRSIATSKGAQPHSSARAQLLGDPQHGIGHLALGPAKVATCQERPDHLADEQWVAAGDVVDPGHHRRGRRPTGQPSHVVAHLRAAEASQPDPAPDPRQVAEHLRQLVDAGLGAAVRADDHDALVGHRLGKEPQQQQRRLVRRMEVVEGHQHRPGAG